MKITISTIVKYSITYLVIAAALMFFNSAALADKKIESYKKHDYPAGPKSIKASTIDRCIESLKLSEKRLLAVCESKKWDNQDDYGLRMVLVDTSDKTNKVIYHSEGSFDSYYMDLSVLNRAADDNSSQIILAESGAEFSYGVKVYEKHGDTIQYLGVMDLTVEKNVDGDILPDTVVPYTVVQKVDGHYEFHFTKAVLKIDDKGEYYSTPKDKIKFVYKNKKLEEVKLK